MIWSTVNSLIYLLCLVATVKCLLLRPGGGGPTGSSSSSSFTLSPFGLSSRSAKLIQQLPEQQQFQISAPSSASQSRVKPEDKTGSLDLMEGDDMLADILQNDENLRDPVRLMELLNEYYLKELKPRLDRAKAQPSGSSGPGSPSSGSSSVVSSTSAFRMTKRADHHGGPRLSIITPIDILRQKIFLDLARRRQQENRHQIQLNAEILAGLGRRRKREANPGESFQQRGQSRDSPLPIILYSGEGMKPVVYNHNDLLQQQRQRQNQKADQQTADSKELALLEDLYTSLMNDPSWMSSSQQQQLDDRPLLSLLISLSKKNNRPEVKGSQLGMRGVGEERSGSESASGQGSRRRRDGEEESDIWR